MPERGLAPEGMRLLISAHPGTGQRARACEARVASSNAGCIRVTWAARPPLCLYDVVRQPTGQRKENVGGEACEEEGAVHGGHSVVVRVGKRGGPEEVGGVAEGSGVVGGVAEGSR